MFVQRISYIQNNVRSKVQKLPVTKVPEKFLFSSAGGGIEGVCNESKATFFHRLIECEGIELQIAGCKTINTSIQYRMEYKFLPTQIDSKLATVPSQVM